MRTLAPLLAAAACASPGGSAGAPAKPCHVTGPSQTSSTASYTMSVATGAPERMYSPSQVAAEHPTDGEVMLRGSMTGDGATHDMGSMGEVGASTGGAGSAAGASLQHVEVHICSRATGQVIDDALPTMIVVDRTTGQTDYLPVAVMQGVTAGASDLHYGNNVAIPAGHQLTLTVTLGGEDARFPLSR